MKGQRDLITCFYISPFSISSCLSLPHTAHTPTYPVISLRTFL